MNTRQRLRELLVEVRNVDDRQYIERCVTHHVKTFYFFCERLVQAPSNAPLSSKQLNDYILAQLRDRKIAVSKQFNPQGWFGKAWTEGDDSSRNERHLRNEYRDVPIRTGSNPYLYQIHPKCARDVVDVFEEFRSASDGNHSPQGRR